MAKRALFVLVVFLLVVCGAGEPAIIWPKESWLVFPPPEEQGLDAAPRKTRAGTMGTDTNGGCSGTRPGGSRGFMAPWGMGVRFSLIVRDPDASASINHDEFMELVRILDKKIGSMLD